MGKRTIEVLPRTYQPTRAEIKEEFSIDATPEQLAKSLLKPVDIRERDAAEHRARRHRAVCERRFKLPVE